MKNSQVNWFASFLTELHGVQKCPSIRAGLHYDFTIRSPLGPLVLAALRQYLGAPMSAMSRKKVERIDAWHEGQSEFLAMSSDSEGRKNSRAPILACSPSYQPHRQNQGDHTILVNKILLLSSQTTRARNELRGRELRLRGGPQRGVQ